jgi:AcrR family transcriptional regulator
VSRDYVLKRRAEAMEDTRRRIVQAAVDLHGTVGPAQTTISAIAERAGVERLTVYRHFPDETQLFAACSQHWIDQHPPPEIGRWSAIANPDARLGQALGELYAYYRQSEGMLRNTLRDAASVPALAGAMAAWEGYVTAAADVLARGRPIRGPRQAQRLALIGHTLDFQVWSSLATRQIPDAVAAEVMVQWLRAAETSRRAGPSSGRSARPGWRGRRPPRPRSA